MNQIKLQIPKSNPKTKTNNTIPNLNENIKDILKELIEKQNIDVDYNNEKDIKEALDKADMIIVECHNTEIFKPAKNSDFNRVRYEYQSLKLRYESYRINKQMKIVTEAHEEIKRQQDDIAIQQIEIIKQQSAIESKQENIIEQQIKMKEESNNLVYNILGFIASFSVVSASISAIDKLNSLPKIMLFMAFVAFILLTTLIGLNNFYKRNDKSKKLQNNYFLWKMMIVVIIILAMYSGIEYAKNNLKYILNCIGEGIGKTVTVEYEYNQSNKQE